MATTLKSSEETLAEALDASHALLASETRGSPIYTGLIGQKEHSSRSLHIRYASPDVFEPLETRLWQKDVAKGCIDPDLLGIVRDMAEVSVMICDDGLQASNSSSKEWQTLHIPCFLAHLANPLALVDPEIDEATFGPLWRDGTWTGTLIWDSAVHACELLLNSSEWRERLRGTCGNDQEKSSTPLTCLELGCGLGLPGFVCHLLGCSPVILTDRHEVASLVDDAIKMNGLNAIRDPLHDSDSNPALAPASSEIRAVDFAWSAASAEHLKATELRGNCPDLLIACDCIFAPLFGSSFLLLEMLLALTSPTTVILLALERRPQDGADAFFEQAAAAGFQTTLWLRCDRVLVCEMRLLAKTCAAGATTQSFPAQMDTPMMPDLADATVSRAIERALDECRPH